MENTEQQSYPSPSDMQDPTPHHLNERQAAARKKRLLLIIGGGILLVLLASATLWFFVFHGKANAPTQSSSTGQNQQNAAPAVPDPTDPTPVTFKSTKLNIELTHRKDWTLKEGSTGQITLTSPKVSRVDATGMATVGVFTLKIRMGASAAMKETIEKAIAVKDSEVIAYDAPTESQRYYTNVSYGGKDADNFGFFIVTGSTELKAGKPFAYMLSFTDESFLIAGGYGVDKSDALAFDAVPKASLSSDVEEQGLAIVKSIKIF